MSMYKLTMKSIKALDQIMKRLCSGLILVCFTIGAFSLNAQFSTRYFETNFNEGPWWFFTVRVDESMLESPSGEIKYTYELIGEDSVLKVQHIKNAVGKKIVKRGKGYFCGPDVYLDPEGKEKGYPYAANSMDQLNQSIKDFLKTNPELEKVDDGALFNVITNSNISYNIQKSRNYLGGKFYAGSKTGTWMQFNKFFYFNEDDPLYLVDTVNLLSYEGEVSNSRHLEFRTIEYLNGLKHGPFKWRSNFLNLNGQYLINKPEGIWYLRNSNFWIPQNNREIRIEYPFKGGKLTGLLRIYYESTDELIASFYVKDNELVGPMQLTRMSSGKPYVFCKGSLDSDSNTVRLQYYSPLGDKIEDLTSRYFYMSLNGDDDKNIKRYKWDKKGNISLYTVRDSLGYGYSISYNDNGEERTNITWSREETVKVRRYSGITWHEYQVEDNWYLDMAITYDGDTLVKDGEGYIPGRFEFDRRAEYYYHDGVRYSTLDHLRKVNVKAWNDIEYKAYRKVNREEGDIYRVEYKLAFPYIQSSSVLCDTFPDKIEVVQVGIRGDIDVYWKTHKEDRNNLRLFIGGYYEEDTLTAIVWVRCNTDLTKRKIHGSFLFEPNTTKFDRKRVKTIRVNSSRSLASLQYQKRSRYYEVHGSFIDHEKEIWFRHNSSQQVVEANGFRVIRRVTQSISHYKTLYPYSPEDTGKSFFWIVAQVKDLQLDGKRHTVYYKEVTESNATRYTYVNYWPKNNTRNRPLYLLVFDEEEEFFNNGEPQDSVTIRVKLDLTNNSVDFVTKGYLIVDGKETYIGTFRSNKYNPQWQKHYGLTDEEYKALLREYGNYPNKE